VLMTILLGPVRTGGPTHTDAGGGQDK
jgi:hypothetical protein